MAIVGSLPFCCVWPLTPPPMPASFALQLSVCITSHGGSFRRTGRNSSCSCSACFCWWSAQWSTSSFSPVRRGSPSWCVACSLGALDAPVGFAVPWYWSFHLAAKWVVCVPQRSSGISPCWGFEPMTTWFHIRAVALVSFSSLGKHASNQDVVCLTPRQCIIMTP